MQAATWVREGAVLPIGTVSDRPDYNWAQEMQFRAFAAQDGTRRVEVPSPDGSSTAFEVTVSGGEVSAVAV
jgi:alpha-D-xyloside xylohydrolase